MATEITTRLTYEDLQQLPDDGKRYEIIDGELLVTPSPLVAHQRVSRNIEFHLHRYVTEQGIGEVFDAPLDVKLSEDTVVQPDILFVSTERRDRVGDRCIEGAPDLIVEILSPGTAGRDRGIKAKTYASHDVLEYWIVDIDARCIEVFAPSAAGYALHSINGADSAEPLNTPLFPDLQLDLAESFAGLE